MFRLWTSIDVRLRVAAVAVAAAVLLPLAWYLGSPLFIDVAVDERFPEAVPLVAPTGAPAAAMPTAPAAAAMPTTVPTAPAPTAVPAAPVALSRGQF
ncbi:MAG TPA: hypothetical protein VF897_14250, partial [Roseiflexaceae bacterium]